MYLEGGVVDQKGELRLGPDMYWAKHWDTELLLQASILFLFYDWYLLLWPFIPKLLQGDLPVSSETNKQTNKPMRTLILLNTFFF